MLGGEEDQTDLSSDLSEDDLQFQKQQLSIVKDLIFFLIDLIIYTADDMSISKQTTGLFNTDRK